MVPNHVLLDLQVSHPRGRSRWHAPRIAGRTVVPTANRPCASVPPQLSNVEMGKSFKARFDVSTPIFMVKRKIVERYG